MTDDSSSATLSTDIRWASVPEWVILHEHLSGWDVRVYAYLVRRANTNSRAWPSFATIADAIHTSPSTVKRCVATLVEVGALTVEERGDPRKHTNNRYVVWAAPPWMRSPNAGRRVSQAGPPADKAGPPVDGAGPPVDEAGPPVTSITRVSKREPVNERENVRTLAAPEPSAVSAVASPLWDEAVRLCDLLADSIVATGDATTKRPTATKAWVTEMERLLRLDGKEADHVERAIAWAHQDSFWSTNILSPQALRRGWEKMVRQAARQRDIDLAHSAREPTGLDAIRAYAQQDTGGHR